MKERRWPAGLAEIGYPRTVRTVRPVLAEDFSYLIRSRAGIRLRLQRDRARTAKPHLLH